MVCVIKYETIITSLITTDSVVDMLRLVSRLSFTPLLFGQGEVFRMNRLIRLAESIKTTRSIVILF